MDGCSNLLNCNLTDYDSDYTIYLRLAALVAFICTFFSVCIVFYFAVIREHPDKPDETDEIEKERFYQIHSHHGNNLCNEIIKSISLNTYMPISLSTYMRSLKRKVKQRFDYLFAYRDNGVKCQFEAAKQHDIANEELSHGQEIRLDQPVQIPSRTEVSSYRKPESIFKDSDIVSRKPLSSVSNVSNKQQKVQYKKNSSSFSFFKKLFKNKNNNRNANNSNDRLLEEIEEEAEEEFDMANPFYEANTDFLDITMLTSDMNLNEFEFKLKNPEDSIDYKYSDAFGKINFIQENSSIGVLIFKILNLTQTRDLFDVHFAFVIEYDNKFQRYCRSKNEIKKISSKTESDYSNMFYISLDKNGIFLNLFKMYILIVGKIIEKQSSMSKFKILCRILVKGDDLQKVDTLEEFENS